MEHLGIICLITMYDSSIEYVSSLWLSVYFFFPNENNSYFNNFEIFSLEFAVYYIRWLIALIRSIKFWMVEHFKPIWRAEPD